MPINILKTNLKNLEKDINLSQIGMENDKNVDLNFDTLDKVYIESSSNIQDLTDAERITSATDFAIISGCASPSWAKAENGKPGAQIWLRDLSLNTLKLTPAIKVIKEYGTITSSYTPNVHLGICPCLSIEIDQLFTIYDQDGFSIAIQINTLVSANHYVCVEMYFPYTFICIKICRNPVILDGAFVLSTFGHILKSYFSLSCIYKPRSFYTRLAFYIYRRIFGIRKMR